MPLRKANSIYFFFAIFYFCTLSAASAQSASGCVITAINERDITIDDFDTVRVRFRIDNAFISDLANPLQSICELKINFDHENLSDLDIRLTAPSGETIFLVGPALGNTTIPSPIFPISHDISFLPSSQVVIPDPDLSSSGIWDNNNPGWGPGPYTGSYYPYFGDIDTSFHGSVNGIWEITFYDDFLNNTGLVRSVELIFCDSRLSCENCEAESSIADTQVISICKLTDIQLSDYFTPRIADTLKYHEEFVIYQNDILVLRGVNPDISVLDTGTYQLTSVAVAGDQLVTFSPLINNLTLSQMRDTVLKPGGVFCSDIGTPISLEVFEVNDTLFQEAILCRNSFILFGGDTIRTPDIYYSDPVICDTLIALTVRYDSLSLLSDSLYRLDCRGTDITATAILKNAIGEATFRWFDNQGLDTLTDTLLINQIGEYYVEASDDICSLVDTVQVVSIVDFLTFEAQPQSDEINCLSTKLEINPVANFDISFISINNLLDTFNDNTVINQAGDYILFAHGVNGCVLSDTVKLNVDTLAPTVMVFGGEISCEQASVLLNYTGDDLQSSIWLDRDSFPISTDSIYEVGAPGLYFLRAQGFNYCETTYPVIVTIDTNTVVIGGLRDSVLLTCQDRSVNLSAIVESGIVERSYWLNSRGDTVSLGLDFEFIATGSYAFEALSDNGCLVRREVLANLDTLRPLVVVMGEKLDCANPLATLAGFSDVSPVFYSWQGPSIVGSMTDSIIQIDQGGIYQLTIQNQVTGCSNVQNYRVEEDLEVPSIIVGGISRITCTNSQAELAYLGNDSLSGFWVSPSLDTFPGLNKSTTETGLWIFSGSGRNGCPGIATITVTADTLIPVVNLPNEITLTCRERGATIRIPNAFEFDIIEWRSTDSLVLSTDSIFSISNNTLKEVYAENALGCSVTHQFAIEMDTMGPPITLRDSVLSCSVQRILIDPNLSGDSFSFDWLYNNSLISKASTLTITQPGDYQLEVTDINTSCISIADFTIINDQQPPTLSISGDTLITCADSSAIILLSTDIENQIIWTLANDTLSSVSGQIAVDVSGDYKYLITSPNGCTAEGVWSITSDKDIVDLDIPIFELNCVTPTVNFTIDSANYSRIIWVYDDGKTIETPTIKITADLISVITYNQSGCSQTDPVTINVDTLPPLTQLMVQNLDYCTDDLPILSVSLDTGDYDFIWTRDDVQIAVHSQVIADQEGVYQVEIQKNDNGCLLRLDTFIAINAAPFGNLSIFKSDESCLDAMDGTLNISNIEGGNDPIMITINNLLVTSNTLEGLAPGTYEVHIEDFYGCSLDTILTINTGVTFTVDLGSDITITQGDFVRLNTSLSSPDAQIEWYVNGTKTRDTTSTISYQPFSPQEVIVVVTSSTGCITSDTVNIQVDVNLDFVDIYIPQVLALNASNSANSVITTTLPGDVIRLESFAVYDRWGQRVHLLENVDTRSSFILWDGKMNGEDVQAGVYVYVYELLSVHDGFVQTKSGDITVLK